MNSTPFICIGHRGAAGHAPENTLAAVRKGFELGATWVEIDVQAVEGELICLHDARLERTTNGTGYAREKSIKDLRALDAGNGEKIPFLSEIFDEALKRGGVNIEIKTKGCAELISKLIKRYVNEKSLSYEKVIASSFIHSELVELKQHNPKILRAPIIYGLPLNLSETARIIEAYSIHIHRDNVTSELVDEIHRSKRKVFVYTVNHPEDIERVKKMGVDGVFTDFPERVIGRD